MVTISLDLPKVVGKIFPINLIEKFDHTYVYIYTFKSKERERENQQDVSWKTEK